MKDRFLRAFIRIGNLRHDVSTRLKNERGAGTVEYALVIAVIVLIVVGAGTFMRDPLIDFFEGVVDKVTDWMDSN